MSKNPNYPGGVKDEADHENNNWLWSDAGFAGIVSMARLAIRTRH